MGTCIAISNEREDEKYLPCAERIYTKEPKRKKFNLNTLHIEHSASSSSAQSLNRVSKREPVLSDPKSNPLYASRLSTMASHSIH